jgi:hypothetical protein
VFASSRGPEDQGGRSYGELARRTRPAEDQHHASHQQQATARARTRRPARQPSSPALQGTRRPDAPAAEEPRRTARYDATTRRPIDHVPGLSLTRSTRVKGHVVTTRPCAHPVGMRRPALAQAPAFRAPGGAAVTPRAASRGNNNPPHPSRQPAPSPPAAVPRPAHSAHPAPGNGHEPQHGHRPQAATSRAAPAPRRSEQATELTEAKGTSRVRALVFRPPR